MWKPMFFHRWGRGGWWDVYLVCEVMHSCCRPRRVFLCSWWMASRFSLLLPEYSLFTMKGKEPGIPVWQRWCCISWRKLYACSLYIWQSSVLQIDCLFQETVCVRFRSDIPAPHCLLIVTTASVLGRGTLILVLMGVDIIFRTNGQLYNPRWLHSRTKVTPTLTCSMHTMLAFVPAWGWGPRHCQLVQ